MLKRNLIVIFILLFATANPAGAIKYKGDLEANESLILPEQSAQPANPASGKHKLYFKDDGAPYSLDPSGNENPIDRAGFKNYLINGGFDLWQRGTGFTTMSAYGADRWKHNSGGTATVSRQAFALGQTAVPGEPQYYWRNDTTVAGAAVTILFEQRIESVRTLAGQAITLSFWAKNSATKTFQVVVTQVFGTGGTPSSNVDAVSTSQSITSTWTKYTFSFAVPSIAGKTLGTNGDDYLQVLIGELSGFSTFTLDVAQIQLEKGSVPTAFERRPAGMELRLAQRYYCKSYQQVDAPGTNTNDGVIESRVSGVAVSAHSVRVPARFPATMRVKPAVTLYAPDGTAGQWSAGAGGNVTANIVRLSQDYFNVEGTTPSQGDAILGGHYAADAEL